LLPAAAVRMSYVSNYFEEEISILAGRAISERGLAIDKINKAEFSLEKLNFPDLKIFNSLTLK
jgi:hypothetical protein